MLDIKILLTKVLASLDSQSGQGGQAGMIEMYGGTTAPTGWLFCDGSTLNVVDYPELAAVLGSIYGGDGTTTFALPDLRGRFPIGAGTSTATDATLHTLNQKDGTETVTLKSNESGLPAHGHGGTFTRPTVSSSGKVTDGITGGSHSHNTYYTTANRGSGNTSTRCGPYGSNYTAITTNSTTHTHDLPNHTHTLTGGGYTVANATPQDAVDGHNNMPPFIGVNFIICTGRTS